MWTHASALALIALAGCPNGSGTGSPDAGEVPTPPVTAEVRRIASPPTYQGTVNNQGPCARIYETAGFEPVAAGKHPLFLYFIGTTLNDEEPGSRFDGPAPMWVADAMARRGFVALSVGYDNTFRALVSDHQAQLACLFDASKNESLIARACSRPNVDCSKGIATWGHSQGGFVAAKAFDVEPRVKAVWTTGYAGDGAPSIPKSRIRMVGAENEGKNADREVLNAGTGLSCTTGDSCFGSDGQGWIIVRKSQLATVNGEAPSADHCWFDRRKCLTYQVTLEPTWLQGDAGYALEPNADWLAQRARMP